MIPTLIQFHPYTAIAIFFFLIIGPPACWLMGSFIRVGGSTDEMD